MPLQIKELHIKMNVKDKEGDDARIADPVTAKESGGADKSDLVEACVEQVLEILREKMEP